MRYLNEWLHLNLLIYKYAVKVFHPLKSENTFIKYTASTINEKKSYVMVVDYGSFLKMKVVEPAQK